jgi:hypothetical protein
MIVHECASVWLVRNQGIFRRRLSASKSFSADNSNVTVGAGRELCVTEHGTAKKIFAAKVEDVRTKIPNKNYIKSCITSLTPRRMLGCCKC